MKRSFRKFRDDRFALTTLQNPLCEVRTQAELIAAAERERALQSPPAPTPEPRPLASPPQIIEAIPPPPPSAPPEPPAESLTAPAAPPPEKKRNPRPKRKPRPRKKSTPHRIVKGRRYAKRHRKPMPKPAPEHEEATAEEIERAVAPELAPDYDDPTLPALERHARKCVICHHPERAGIEEHFLNWHNTDAISNQYNLHDFRPIYRHARATGLLQQRRANLRFAAELIIEHADAVVPTAESVIRAIRISARINDEGQWVEPPSHVIVSSGGRVNTPQYGPLPQISMTQVILPPTAQSPTPQPPSPEPTAMPSEALSFDFAPVEVAQLEVPSVAIAPQQPAASGSAETPQPSAANDARGKFSAHPAAISPAETHEILIGHTAIRNRRNPLKTKGALPF